MNPYDKVIDDLRTIQGMLTDVHPDDFPLALERARVYTENAVMRAEARRVPETKQEPTAGCYRLLGSVINMVNDRKLTIANIKYDRYWTGQIKYIGVTFR